MRTFKSDEANGTDGPSAPSEAAGKRTRTQDLAPRSAFTPVQLRAASSSASVDAMDFTFADALPDKPRTYFKIAGQRLDAESGFQEFQYIEMTLSLTNPAAVLELRQAAKTDICRLATFAGITFDDLLPADIMLLETIVQHYVTFIPILESRPTDQPAELLRKDLVTLGYDERDHGRKEDAETHPTEGEIDCNIDPKTQLPVGISMDLSQLASRIFAALEQDTFLTANHVKVEVSGGNDKAHNRTDNQHSRGNALDFVVHPGEPDAILDAVCRVLDQFLTFKLPGQSQVDEQCYLDEYRHKSRDWTGAHFHIQVAPRIK